VLADASAANRTVGSRGGDRSVAQQGGGRAGSQAELSSAQLTGGRQHSIVVSWGAGAAVWRYALPAVRAQVATSP
jgi:hypothetical protein